MPKSECGWYWDDGYHSCFLCHSCFLQVNHDPPHRCLCGQERDSDE